MAQRKLPLSLLLLLLTTCKENVAPTPPPPPPIENPQSVSVLTQHNDNTRAGWNDNETALTTSNVNVQQFGKLFTLAVDGQVYAQPLVVGHVSIGGGTHNVVYVATVTNTVYAFDGDDGRLYWQKNFTAPGMRPPSHSDMTGACGGSYQDFNGNIGIVGTPVIDGAKGTMYFVARSTTGSTFVQHLHAVNIADGSEVAGGPTAITATYRGNGDGSVNGVIAFDAQRQNQRQGLTLLNGAVYVVLLIALRLGAVSWLDTGIRRHDAAAAGRLQRHAQRIRRRDVGKRGRHGCRCTGQPVRCGGQRNRRGRR